MASSSATVAETAASLVFPLYRRLVEKSDISTDNGRCVPKRDWQAITRSVLSFDNERLEILLALILVHSLQEKLQSSKSASTAMTFFQTKLPYKGKTYNAGLGFVVDIENIPPRLQEIIYFFVEACIKV